MSSSTSTPPPPSFPSLTSSSLITITTKEFNDFHSIDRLLFTRLVLTLGRDPAQSTQVMALWLWLERTLNNHFLIAKMLSLSLPLLNSLADEAIICLNCTETDTILQTTTHDLPLLQSVLGSNRDISLLSFHENRIGVFRGVTKIVNEVCARAFEDILRNAFGNYYHYPIFGGGGGSSSSVSTVPFYPGVEVFESGGVADYEKQKNIMNEELGELLESVSLSVTDEDQQEMKEVPEDDRTIFLTFSKGYPIYENEVRDFFTRKFGELIEAIHMQEVPSEEQSLYARLVVGSATAVPVVLGGQTKAKYSINGKHVWARKYVKKNQP